MADEVILAKLSQLRALGEKFNQVTGELTQQSALLSSFDQLNDEGQGKAVEYVEDLVATGRYKKSCEPGLGQKEA